MIFYVSSRTRFWTLNILLVCIFLNASCGAFNLRSKKNHGPDEPDYDLPPSGFVPSLGLYANCQEIQEDIRSQLELQRRNQAAQQAYYNSLPRFPFKSATMENSTASSAPDSFAGGSAKNASSASSAGADGATNVQEKGVDEADFVKISQNHLFVYSHNRIKVSDRSTLKELGHIDVRDLTHVTLYTKDDRLILLGHWTPSSPVDSTFGLERASTPDSVQTSDEKTVVKVFSTSKGSLPTLVKEHTFRGDYLDTRMLEDQLIIVFRDTMPLKTIGTHGNPLDQTVALDQNQATVHGVRCSSFVKPLVPDMDLRISIITALDTKNSDKTPQHLATVGGGDLIYMTTRNIYLAKYSRVWWPWIDPRNQEQVNAWEHLRQMENLYLTKVSFTRDGQLVATAAGSVVGRVKDQWAFKELPEENLLSVATTTGQAFGRQGLREGANHLFILEQKGSHLSVTAPVQHFAPGEDIRSVRYVGNIAYIVTFKTVDPLFAFDLSQPRAPKILGELKIPGFSTYMHPLAQGRLLGIGFDAIDKGSFAVLDGVQVSLFDTSDPRNLARLDNHVLGKRGSGSDVTGNHHAFYYDELSKLVGVPVVMVNQSPSSMFNTYERVEFSGAVMYRLEGDKIREIARISHIDLMPQICRNSLQGSWSWQDRYQSLDINRLYTVDGRLLSISRFGIKAHSLDDPSMVAQSVQFSGVDNENCR
jgi:uncharacterized secreted protein with C-terminal beta-propeller domain